jgi:hypothetical protein
MKIEAGKEYRTRDGRKARVYATDGISPYVVHGAIQTPQGWSLQSWITNGAKRSDGLAGTYMSDLVSEWVNLPEVDWSKLPAWFSWVAQLPGGIWCTYNQLPKLTDLGWSLNGLPIPMEYAPKWSGDTGDWRQSLVERPKA